jgi:hypothetical protein
VQSDLEDRYAQQWDEPGARAAVRAYTTLTLVRHIHISSQFPDRQHCTLPLLDLCESRLHQKA